MYSFPCLCWASVVWSSHRVSLRVRNRKSRDPHPVLPRFPPEQGPSAKDNEKSDQESFLGIADAASPVSSAPVSFATVFFFLYRSLPFIFYCKSTLSTDVSSSPSLFHFLLSFLPIHPPSRPHSYTDRNAPSTATTRL